MGMGCRMEEAVEYRDRAIDQFEQLYSDATESARVMALVAHPYLMGVPHRLRYFREALEHISKRPGSYL
jgi:allantoinase